MVCCLYIVVCNTAFLLVRNSSVGAESCLCIIRLTAPLFPTPRKVCGYHQSSVCTVKSHIPAQDRTKYQ